MAFLEVFDTGNSRTAAMLSFKRIDAVVRR